MARGYNVNSRFGMATAAEYRLAREMRDAIGGHITEPDPEPVTEKLFECPACHAVQTGFESYIGTLARVRHHRCCYCGVGFTESAERGSQ